MIVQELRKQFRSDYEYNLALYAYVYSNKYKEELNILKEGLDNEQQSIQESD